jgi:drug/metabolite transporter (DMT)-like permease
MFQAIADRTVETMKTRIGSALLAIYLAWGTTYLAIRVANETMPPFLMTGVRFLVAGLILYVWRRLAGDPTPTKHQWRSAIIIGSFMLAEKYVPSGIAALIVAATPLWVVLIEAIRPGGHRPTWLTMAGVLVGLAGIFILIDPFRTSGLETGISLAGASMVLLAALCWSIGSIYNRSADLPQSSLLGSGMELLAGSAGSFLVGLILGEGHQLNLAGISLRSLAGLGYLIVIGSLVAYVCYTWLLRVAPTNLVVTYTYVNPLVAIILGSLLAQETMNVRVLFAIPLIISAVGLIHMREAKEKPVPRTTMAVHASAGED